LIAPRKLFIALLFILPFVVTAQRKNLDFRYNIKKATGIVHVDGEIDASWNDCQTASNFNMVLPMDTSKALVRTDVKMTYDDHHLYIIAICYIKEDQPFMVESLKRDFNFGKNDNFLLFMDPFDDQINGFTFGSNAAGAQWDGLLFDGAWLWEEYLNKWNAGIQKRKETGVWKNGLTLTEMQEKYGIENGYNRWKNRIDARKYTLSLNGFIERFGKEDGIIQYYCYVDKMVSNCRKLGGFSKISQKLFDEIYNKLDENKQTVCKYYTKSGEEKFYITEVDGLTMMFVDFKCGNAIIEFDGDYWHSTQATQSRDKIKQKILEDRGYRVFRVKEREYKANKETTTQDCINFINKYYERT
jgi:hypothetical protein